jgi:hypothetical protein
MIFGPQYSYPPNRIQPIDGDHQESDQRDGKKKRVLYQGRAWAEAEDELSVQPTMPQNPQKVAKNTLAPEGVYADKAVLEKAHKWFRGLITLEEKAAQLCFLVTDAVYDAEVCAQVELLIQAWQIGGLLFHHGEFRRQIYLIHRYQELSKTPLLLANDFLHGLSFYLQGAPLPSGPISQQYYLDLGRAVMAQNRGVGVQVQFDRERDDSIDAMSESQAKAFRKGVRNARGLVGKRKNSPKTFADVASKPGGLNHISLREGALTYAAAKDLQSQETISFKTLTFFDATQIKPEDLEQALHGAFKQLDEALLLGSNNITDGVRTIVHLITSGKLSEAVLDKHVMKVLIMKAYFL